MNLTATAAFANVVNVQSVELERVGITENRVTPNQPDMSYTVEKLQSDTPRDGVRMPVGQPLDSARLEMVVSWIQNGALDN